MRQTTTLASSGFALSLYYYVKRDYYIKEGSVGTSNGVLGFDSLPTTRSDKIIPQKRDVRAADGENINFIVQRYGKF